MQRGDAHVLRLSQVNIVVLGGAIPFLYKFYLSSLDKIGTQRPGALCSGFFALLYFIVELFLFFVVEQFVHGDDHLDLVTAWLFACIP